MFHQFYKFVCGLLLFGLIFVSLASSQICIPDAERVDCHPEWGASEKSCIAKGCTWCPAEIPDIGTPYCFVPKTYGYKMLKDPEVSDNGFRVELYRATNISYIGSDFELITVVGEYQSNYRLRVKITNGQKRFEVPLNITKLNSGTENRLYEVYLSSSTSSVFSFKIVRKKTGTVLFDTSLGGFTFANQFLQLTTRLPNRNLYGIGENEQSSFRHSFQKYSNWPLWGRDEPPNGNANLYGVQPHYTVLEDDGNAHSVVFVNSNAQEFTILPTPGLLYRTIGGIFDIYFFFGPTPENVVQQYTEAVGRASIPPYWALGFQLCRYGYNSLDKMQGAVSRTAAAGIPQDVQYGDIDIMERQLDFTYSKDRFGGLPEYIKQLKTSGIKFVTILDPCISIGEPVGSYRPFDLGNEMDVWIKKSNGVPVIGKVWPNDPVYFPDYTKVQTRDWWIILIKEFKNLLDFDALWIDMNEPANFVAGDFNEGCPINTMNNPKYLPKIRGDYLPDKTLCGDHKDTYGFHYDTHSLYGWLESEPTLAGVKEAFENKKRGFILSRSTYLGSGKWTAHWLGDNWSKWSNLHFSIIGMLLFNQFGIPFVGADICGFIGNSSAELCQRWMELGAFYPFSRNHNGLDYIDQDPAIWGPAVAASSKTALEIRYNLLPYLYTLFYQHYSHGNTVIRALWHEFPNDPNTHGIDRQFMWGSGLIVSPVLEEGMTTIQIYFPNARIYNYYDGIEVTTRGGLLTLPAPLSYIHLHVHGGNILPTQEPAINTQLARKNPIGLIIALDDNKKAKGLLYYDDGISPDPIESGKYFHVEYSIENGNLTVDIKKDGYIEMSNIKLETIRLFGAGIIITNVTVNGMSHQNFENKISGEIFISKLNLNANSKFNIHYYNNGDITKPIVTTTVIPDIIKPTVTTTTTTVLPHCVNH